MCGIAGIYNPSGPFKSKLPLDKIKHRGPDATGDWQVEDRKVWLGHTRLAIVDLSSNGNQPMVDSSNGNVIIFNGEIYNHRKLRENPALRNVEWEGSSDTETLLKSYAVFGEKVVSMLKGMFAFVIWDSKAKKIFAARDRFGIKPLYYSFYEGSWFFGSETKLFPNQILSPIGLSSYLRFGACQDEALILEGVEAVPPAATLTLHADQKPKIESYWPLGDLHPIRCDYQEAQCLVRGALEQSVCEHLLSDVPLACFLSGGVDSSVLTGLITKFYPGQLKTFSLGFPQKGFDETIIAQKVAKKWSTDHTRIELQPAQVCEWVKEGLMSMDLPSVDGINTYVLSKAVQNYGVKVAFSGLGGDELFGGYPSFFEAFSIRTFSHLPRMMAEKIALLGGDKTKRLGDIAGERVSLATAAMVRRIMTCKKDLELLKLPALGLESYSHFFNPDSFSDVSWTELRGYMRNMLLRDADQMGMAVSLEIRVPFLDHQLTELCFALDRSHKLPQQGMKKGLLIDACRDLLPPETYRHPKKCFLLPMTDWMGNELRDFSEEGLLGVIEIFPEFQVFIRKQRAGVLKGHLSWTRLWIWVVLGHWLKLRKPIWTKK